MLRHAAGTSDEPTACSDQDAAVSVAAIATGAIFCLDAVICQRVLCTLDKPIPMCQRSHPLDHAMHAENCSKQHYTTGGRCKMLVTAFPAPRACRKACSASSLQLLSKASHIKRRPFLGQGDAKGSRAVRHPTGLLMHARQGNNDNEVRDSNLTAEQHRLHQLNNALISMANSLSACGSACHAAGR
jgi:hypothetical protein